MAPSSFKGMSGFLARDIQRFSERLNALDSLEMHYFESMHRLIVGEQAVAKLGSQSTRQNNGLAGIWLLSDQMKEESFSLLKDLVI